MAISVKSKFAGFLRGILRRGDDREPARPVAVAPPPPPKAVPAASAPVPRASAPAQPVQTASADVIELPLVAVLAALPLDLRAKLITAPLSAKTIRLPAEKVLVQLAFGTVKISFGELRQLAPGVFVNSGGELDGKLINLPLNEILPRINPALLARRSAKKIEVAAEIAGPFADRGRGFTFTTKPLKGEAAPAPAPIPAPQIEKPAAPTPPIALTPRAVAPAPTSPQFPPRSITPAAPTSNNGNGHSQSLPVSPLSPPSAPPTKSNGNGSNGNGNGHHSLPVSPLTPRSVTPAPANGNGLPPPPNLRLAASEVPPAAEKIPAAPAPFAPPASRADGAQPTISVSLGDLCDDWPEELKNEIIASPLARATVALDPAIVLPGLKRGRVVMTWKQLRELAQPKSAASPKDGLELALPLSVIAPLFLAAQKNVVRPRAKASVSADIPDLFFGFPQPAAAPAAPVAPLVPPLPKPPEQKTPDTNFFPWNDKSQTGADEAGASGGATPQTDFANRQSHPKDTVARAAALPGVAGAVVAMQDGLRVASQVPPDLNADALAAFLPQIFDRLNQSTRELRMGALNNVNFTVGNVPWKIFRVNAVFFAAFGRAGEALPSAQLAQLAADLDRKKQN